MTSLPLSQDFDDNHPVGWIDISDEAKKLFEDMKTANIDMVFAPTFIVKKYADDGSTILEAELISLSMIPAIRAIKP